MWLKPGWRSLILKRFAATARYRLVEPKLSFGSEGMTMEGADGIYRMTGIQSREKFNPPFTLEAKLSVLESHGNSFIIFMINPDFKSHVGIIGNVNPDVGPSYGVWLNDYGKPLNGGRIIWSTPRESEQYTIRLAMDSDGSARIDFERDEEILNSSLDVRSGSGPFYLLLGQTVGTPAVEGRNATVWKSIVVAEGVGSKSTDVSRKEVSPAIPRVGTVSIVPGGSGAFTGVSPSMKTVSAGPGEPLIGTVKVKTMNRMSQHAVAPFIMVPTWGDRRTNYKVINKWISPKESEHSVEISETAPTEEGIYYLIFAFRGETAAYYVASSTCWTVGHPVWNDGNDLVDFTSSQLEEAMATGHTSAKELFEDGYKEFDFPSDAIRIIVKKRGQDEAIDRTTVD